MPCRTRGNGASGGGGENGLFFPRSDTVGGRAEPGRPPPGQGQPRSAHQEIAGSYSYRSASNFPHDRRQNANINETSVFKPRENPEGEGQQTPPTAPAPRPGRGGHDF